MDTPQGAKLTGTNGQPPHTKNLYTRVHSTIPQHHHTHNNPTAVAVVIAPGKRPVPYRTRKLSLDTPMVLHPPGCGRVGHHRHPPLTRGPHHTPTTPHQPRHGQPHRTHTATTPPRATTPQAPTAAASTKKEPPPHHTTPTRQRRHPGPVQNKGATPPNHAQARATTVDMQRSTAPRSLSLLERFNSVFMRGNTRDIGFVAVGRAILIDTCRA